MKRFSLPALLAALGFSSFAFAAPEDFTAPIEIEAQRVEVNAQDGSSIYQGDVRLTRGSMLILADKMVLKQIDNQVSADIHGPKDGLAQFSQTTETGEKMEAQAQRIRYFSDQDAIEFDGNAQVKRAADTVSSDHIRYDLRAEQILAGGDNKNDGDNNRVKIVIQPANNQPKE
jgi:lipopolysaccharide export system protein LptA